MTDAVIAVAAHMTGELPVFDEIYQNDRDNSVKRLSIIL